MGSSLPPSFSSKKKFLKNDIGSSHPVFLHLKYIRYQELYQVLRTQMRKSTYSVVGKQTCAQQGNVPDVPNMGVTVSQRRLQH